MANDLREIPVSALTPTALAASDDFNRRLLRLDSGIDAILKARDNEPEDPLLNLYAAVLHLYAQNQTGLHAAGNLLDIVERHPSRLTPRDARLAEALRSFQRGQLFDAQGQLESLTERFPRDLLAAKVCEYVYYTLGQEYNGPRYRAHLDRMETDNGADPDFLGMQAFSYELCGHLKEAEDLARRALETEPRNPWAHHALSHSLIRQGETEIGIQEMEAFMPELRTCDRLIHCHDAWHLGLLYLEQLDGENTRRVFTESIWPHTPELVGEQLDAISLAWRMDMAGFELTDFWQDIASRTAASAHEAFVPFVSAHYAYAFARAGHEDALATLLETTSRRAEAPDVEARSIWAPTGRNLIEASAAAGQRFHAETVELLRPIIQQVTCVGGSDAQDDLFRQAYVHALVRTGQHSEAAAFRQGWTPFKQPSAFDDLLFSV